MSHHPFVLSLRTPSSTRAGLFRLFRLTLLTVTLLIGANESHATLYQTISLNVMSPAKFRIGRREYPLNEMTAALKGEVSGNDRIRIKIFLPLGTRKEIIEDIKARCRLAGATSFFIVYKS